MSPSRRPSPTSRKISGAGSRRGAPYTPWQQLEHMRIAQGDILEYIRNPQHVSPAWPQGYWPREAAPARQAWAQSVKAFLADR